MGISVSNSPPVISRAEAKASGLKRYFSGNPCKREGHVVGRWTSTGTCIVCNRRWAAANPERMREISRARTMAAAASVFAINGGMARTGNAASSAGSHTSKPTSERSLRLDTRSTASTMTAITNLGICTGPRPNSKLVTRDHAVHQRAASKASTRTDTGSMPSYGSMAECEHSARSTQQTKRQRRIKKLPDRGDGNARKRSRSAISWSRHDQMGKAAKVNHQRSAGFFALGRRLLEYASAYGSRAWGLRDEAYRRH